MAHDSKTRKILEGLVETHGGGQVYVPKKKLLPLEEMKAARKAGKTQAQIAKQFGCSQATVSRHIR